MSSVNLAYRSWLGIKCSWLHLMSSCQQINFAYHYITMSLYVCKKCLKSWSLKIGNWVKALFQEPVLGISDKQMKVKNQLCQRCLGKLYSEEDTLFACLKISRFFPQGLDGEGAPGSIKLAYEDMEAWNLSMDDIQIAYNGWSHRTYVGNVSGRCVSFDNL